MFNRVKVTIKAVTVPEANIEKVGEAVKMVL